MAERSKDHKGTKGINERKEVRDEGMKKSFLIEFKLSFFHWL
jgi:hypothetical protein